jgi:hypothetical protein
MLALPVKEFKRSMRQPSGDTQFQSDIEPDPTKNGPFAGRGFAQTA